MVKVGDKLFYSNEIRRNLVNNKGYIVKETGIMLMDYGCMFYIINDSGNRDYYSCDLGSEWYYKNYFYTGQEMRKMKLRKLEKINEGKRSYM